MHVDKKRNNKGICFVFFFVSNYIRSRKIADSLMNISPQTNGAHVAATNMTTLLQKNCIKTLSVNNGVVVMGTAPVVGNASMINANVVPMSGTPLTSNVTATNLQTHTMIANASHLQPIQAFQYQQLQTVTQAQPLNQYIIYNPSDGKSNDVILFRFNLIFSPLNSRKKKTKTKRFSFLLGSMFRPVVTTTAPVNAIVTSNSLYQPQQQTFVTQNHLPKIGAIKATTLGAQQKVLNIVAPQRQQTTTTITTSTTQNTNTFQHIKTDNNVSHHQIIQNGTNITTDNIINTAPIARPQQILSNSNQTPAIQTQAIKSEAPVMSSSIDSKAATSSTINSKPTIDTTHTRNKFSTEPTETHAPPISETKIQRAESDSQAGQVNETNEEENEPEPEIDIVINNVVCSFSVRCHLNLREIALNGKNVEFRRENGMVTMKLRRPYTTGKHKCIYKYPSGIIMLIKTFSNSIDMVIGSNYMHRCYIRRPGISNHI